MATRASAAVVYQKRRVARRRARQITNNLFTFITVRVRNTWAISTGRSRFANASSLAKLQKLMIAARVSFCQKAKPGQKGSGDLMPKYPDVATVICNVDKQRDSIKHWRRQGQEG